MSSRGAPAAMCICLLMRALDVHAHIQDLRAVAPESISSVNGSISPDGIAPSDGYSIVGVGGPPQITLKPPGVMTACSPFTIQWTSEGLSPFAAMNLVITNAHLSQTITNGLISVSGQEFTWPSVNVTGGNYTLEAFILPSVDNVDATVAVSVRNGTDMSCLTSGPNPSTSSESPPSTRSNAATSSPSPTPTTLNYTSHVSPGIIAGAVMGGIALIAAAITAFACIRIRRRLRRRRDGERLPDGPLLKNWQPETGEIPQARMPTVLALDRLVSPGVMESQEAMLLKAARLRRDIRSAGTSNEQMGHAELTEQLREVTERLAVMEERARTHGLPEHDDFPPNYTFAEVLQAVFVLKTLGGGLENPKALAKPKALTQGRRQSLGLVFPRISGGRPQQDIDKIRKFHPSLGTIVVV
ncbi:hypothetical protein B0H19DRAFT_1318020 [Mycena capillaripes]|nr:hypothetical protein B0H19DRAFT_1318020 [Mycena capillaripes]